MLPSLTSDAQIFQSKAQLLQHLRTCRVRPGYFVINILFERTKWGELLGQYLFINETTVVGILQEPSVLSYSPNRFIKGLKVWTPPKDAPSLIQSQWFSRMVALCLFVLTSLNKIYQLNPHCSQKLLEWRLLPKNTLPME